MGVGNTSFFAIGDDLRANLQPTESAFPLEYVLCGAWPEPRVTVYASITQIPDFGISSTGEEISQTQYLVLPRNSVLTPRRIKQKSGPAYFAVDGVAVGECVLFRHGGTHGDRTLISGLVSAIGQSKGVAGLYRRFVRVCMLGFTNVNGMKVGPRAMELWRNGWRLTQSARFSEEYDLKYRAGA